MEIASTNLPISGARGKRLERFLATGYGNHAALEESLGKWLSFDHSNILLDEEISDVELQRKISNVFDALYNRFHRELTRHGVRRYSTLRIEKKFRLNSHFCRLEYGVEQQQFDSLVENRNPEVCLFAERVEGAFDPNRLYQGSMIARFKWNNSKDEWHLDDSDYLIYYLANPTTRDFTLALLEWFAANYH